MVRHHLINPTTPCPPEDPKVGQVGKIGCIEVAHRNGGLYRMQNRVESDVGIPFSKSIYPSQLNTSKLQIGKGERGSDMVGTSPPLRTAEGVI